jgi:ribulose-phosphate 3-epimerase
VLDIRSKPARPLVAASILSADFGRMAEDCCDVIAAEADLLHVDVMDGHFAPNLTMGPGMVRGLRRHLPDAYIDVHLMVQHPDLFLEPFVEAGANLLSFHLERCAPHHPGGLDAAAAIDRIHALGADAGMVVNPDTPAAGLAPYQDHLQLVLVMSVNPGFSGQAFMPQVLPKARELSANLGAGTRLEMDGGLNLATAPRAVQAGVDILVSASALFGAADRKDVIGSFHGLRGL